MDIAQLENCLTKLKAFQQHDFQQFAINPLHCLNAIYQYLKYGIIRKDFFAEITRFYFNPPKRGENAHDKKANELIYLLATYSTSICQRPLKTLRLINTFNKINTEPSFAYNFFLKIAAADKYFVLEEQNKLQDINDAVSISYKQEEYLFTPFMKSLLYGLKIKNAIINTDYSTINGYMNCLTQVSDESGNKLSKLLIYFTVLNSEQLMNLDPQLYKQVSYNLTKLLRECGLNPDIFVKQNKQEALAVKVKVNH